jgi:hypothetical protein
VPAAQALQAVAPARLNFPATQAPEQDDVFRPVLDPYRPAGHGLHDVASDTLEKVPAAQAVPVLDPAPDPQYRPGTLVQGPLQLALMAPVTLLKRPAGHGVQSTLPASLYSPTPHTLVTTVKPDHRQ